MRHCQLCNNQATHTGTDPKGNRIYVCDSHSVSGDQRIGPIASMQHPYWWAD